MNRRSQLAAVVASMALAIAACSLPTDDEATLIDTEALPEVLRSDLEVTTTIEQGPRTEPVQIFLLRNDGERTIVVGTGRELDPNASFAQEIGLLFRGPDVPDIRTEVEIENGWFNALSQFQLLDAFAEDQVAVIDMVALDADGEQLTVEAEELRDALAQLVYTATGFPEEEPIVAVRVRIAGENVSLPTDGADSESALTPADYASYDVDFVPPPTTEPPTTTTPDPADVTPDEEDG